MDKKFRKAKDKMVWKHKRVHGLIISWLW